MHGSVPKTCIQGYSQLLTAHNRTVQHTHAHAHTHTLRQTCMYAYAHSHARIRTHARARAHTHTRARKQGHNPCCSYRRGCMLVWYSSADLHRDSRAGSTYPSTSYPLSTLTLNCSNSRWHSSSRKRVS